MSISRWKFLAVFFGKTSVVLLICCGWLFVGKVVLSLEVNFANEQTRIFQEMLDESLKSDDPHRAANCLGYVVSYYPSGSKQRQGSQLDAVVERHRKDAAAAIIRRLRELTGKDLGKDPDPWVNEFSKHPL
jgi:hypothetical protein